MSLINDMLKDLEARGGNEAETAKGVRAAGSADAPRATWVVGSLATLVIVLAGAVAYLGWSLNRDSASASKEAAIVTTPEPPAKAEPVVPLVVAEAATPSIEEPETVVEPIESSPVLPMATKAQERLPEPARTEVPERPEEASNKPVTRSPSLASTENVSEESGMVMVRRHEPTPEQRAQRAAQDGLAALRRGDWAAAARLLQEVVAVEPANDDAREGLVIALQRQGRLAETDGVLLDGLAVATSPARFAKLRARLQAERGELEAALDTLAVAMPAVENDPEYHALKAALSQQAGRHEEAAAIYATLTEFAPGNGTWLAGLAIALDQLGEIVEARETYVRALQAGGLDRALVAHAQRRLAAIDQTLENE